MADAEMAIRDDGSVGAAVSDEALLARMKIAFAGGGTAGHLMPGVTVATEVIKRFPDADIVFFGTQGDLEKRVVGGANLRLQQIYTEKRGGSILNLPVYAIRSLVSFVRACRAVREFDPDVLVGLGGFGCVFPVLAASLRRIPTILLEQNVLPGRANRFLAHWANEIDCMWSESAAYLGHKTNVCVTGNPVREAVFTCTREEAARFFGLEPEKKTLFITGGSLGALRMNQIVVEALPTLSQMAGELQIIHCTGELSYRTVSAAYKGSPLKSYVVSYLDKMPLAYALSDLAICRAGGTTIAELLAAGVPSILIPLPTAAEDHQRLNAEAVERGGAGVLADQNSLTGEKLAGIVREMLSGERLKQMRAAAAAMARRDAAKMIVERICGLVRERRLRLAR
jgi:UDP-N-acetylglucosamine--N-acetylmuramyl-(pentapeptide) pyrophosphoryl-undecaprenol N-acetylglucosamine transferase